MSGPITPGQVAYEAYWPAFGMAPQVPWEQVIADNKRAWDAAAQAVLDAFLSSAQLSPLPQEEEDA